MMPSFPDHFSAAAADYAAFRPRYPDALFAWLVAHAPARRRAWDCGAGSGQAAVALAEHFDHVVATDASAAQLARATPHPRVGYAAAAAERAPIATAAADLVTVAQALHWFDRDAFFAEATRVLAPGGFIAAWSYGPMELTDERKPIAYDFYARVVGPYWPPERSLVDTGYGAIAFPFAEVAAPRMWMEHRWTLRETLGYISTWSAVQVYRQQRDADPIPALATALAPAWGDPEARHLVRWPVSIRAGHRRSSSSGGGG